MESPKIKLGISSLPIIGVSAASQMYHCLNKMTNWLPCWLYLDVVSRFCSSGDDRVVGSKFDLVRPKIY